MNKQAKPHFEDSGPLNWEENGCFSKIALHLHDSQHSVMKLYRGLEKLPIHYGGTIAGVCTCSSIPIAAIQNTPPQRA